VELEWDSHAREQLDFLAHRELSRIVDDWALLPCLANMAAACRFLSDTRTAELVLARLAPLGGQHVVKGPAIVYMGPVDYYLGLSKACVRRWDQACECFERAVDTSERISARPMATRARLELARARLVRDRSNDVELAIETCAKARSDAAALGMAGVERRAQALLSDLERSASGPAKRAGL
jgi:hypothetical protein